MHDLILKLYKGS